MKAKYRIANIGLVWADLAEWNDDAESNPQLGAPSPEQVAACKRWIQTYVTPRSGYRRSHDSYTFKHFVEGTPGYPPYITNGAFIQAALELGYTASPASRYSPNARFKMGPRDTSIQHGSWAR